MRIAKKIAQLMIEALVKCFSILVSPLAYYISKDPDMKSRIFNIAQARGLHIVPANYESPIPNTAELPDRLWNSYFPVSDGFQLDQKSQLNLISRLAKYGNEMSDTPANVRVAHEYYWNNPMFGAMDAIVYHAMIREFKPKQVLEVGGGYSTMVAAKAAILNGNTKLRVIEPHPIEPLKKGCPGLAQIITEPVQNVHLSEFEALIENDILFIDDSHICKTGSDVNHIILTVLPRLKPGVIIHLHDIFLPWEYAKQWVLNRKTFYTEQYLLYAFLLFNKSFETVLALQYLEKMAREQLKEAFPFSPVIGGGSFYIRRLK